MGRLKSIPSRLSAAPRQLGSITIDSTSRDVRRRATQPWRAWYDLKRWKDMALTCKVKARFTCQWPGCGRIEADPSRLAADHKQPHRGDPDLFWDERNLQCLCKDCHDRKKQSAERRAGGVSKP